MLVPLEDDAEEGAHEHLLQYAVGVELARGKQKRLVQLVAVVLMVVQEVGDIDAHVIAKLLAHAQVHGVGEHLAAQSACHLYQSHVVV